MRHRASGVQGDGCSPPGEKRVPATIVEADQVLSGATVLELANRGVSGLDSLGCAPGDVIGIMLRNEPTFLVALLACRLGGFTACPINWHFKADEAGFMLRDSRAAVLIVHADLLPQVADGLPAGLKLILVEPSPAVRGAFGLDESACFVPPGQVNWGSWIDEHAPYAGEPRQPRATLPYSSGTTGRPKGIARQPLTPEIMGRAAEVSRVVLGIELGMRTLAVAPLYHSAPTAHAIQSLLAGELIVVHPRFEPEQLLADVERHRLTNLYLVPTLYVRLLRLPDAVKQRYDLSSLRFVASTGSPCPPEVKRGMIEWFGPIITETYASSEAGLLTFCSSHDAIERPGTAGRAVSAVSIRILGDAGDEVPPGTVGRIFSRNEAHADFTYLNNDAARRELEHDRHICVGDLGYVDDDGYLFVCGRESDMVISGGVNIYPAEIEAVLMEMPEVADCAVFGIPDQEYGEALATHVQLRSPGALSEGDVRTFLSGRLAGFKVPRVIHIAETLPREETGKVFKRRIREPYWAGAGRTI
jgi:long-chain acyl-CoA synthetase